MMRPRAKTISQVLVILGAAFALKSFYSTASVNDLRWILSPTTFLVELLTGRQFEFESQAGYMSSDHTFLIAASCSGVNFLIISFLVLGFGKIWRERRGNAEWRSIAFAALVAYVTTLFANTTRIVVALGSQDVELSWLDGEQLHRFEGIVVYFGFLLLLLFASEKMASQGRDLRATALRMIPGLKILLITYYAVTLGIPLIRGSHLEPGFWQHMAFVVLVPLALILPFPIIASITRRSHPQSLP